MELVPYHLAAIVAGQIAQQDFRVTLSEYISRKGSPWVITVGESYWQRHLVIETVIHGGNDATLAILANEQSVLRTLDIDTTKVDRRVSLKELLAGRYSGIRQALDAVHA